MKAVDIAVKNIKLFYREKKVLLMLILIPVMFYSVMGFTFGATSSSDFDLSNYSIGFTNLDANGEKPVNEYQSIENVTKALNFSKEEAEEQGVFVMKGNYTQINHNGLVSRESSLDATKTSLESEEVDIVITFEKGFQARLNEKATTKIGLYDNGTVVENDNIDNLTISLLHSEIYQTVNLTDAQYSQLSSQTMNESDYDYLLVINDGLNCVLLYRQGIEDSKLNALSGEIQGVLTFITQSISGSPEVSLSTRAIDKTSILPGPKYTLYYLQSMETTVKSILIQTISSMIDNVINYDPSTIPLESNESTISGEVLNAITTGTPGYLLYGMMTIMSFATTLLTEEVKEGLLKRLKSTRMKNSQLLAGNLLANTFIVIFQFLLGIGVLAAFGFDPIFHSVATLLGGSLLNLFVISFFLNSLAFFLVPIFKHPEAAGGGVWIVLIPLMMFSGAFFPLELVAPILVGPSQYIPTRMSVLVFQGLYLDGYSLGHPKIWANLLGQIAYGIVLFVAGTKMFNNFSEKGVKRRKSTKKKS